MTASKTLAKGKRGEFSLPAKRTLRDRVSPPLPSPLPGRSRRAPAALSRPMCLRCAQYIGSNPPACDKGAKKCWRCTAAHKACVPVSYCDSLARTWLIIREVPANFVKAVERLRVDCAEPGVAPAQLQVRARALHSEIVQHQRNEARSDGVSGASRRGGGDLLLLVRELRALRGAIESGVDSYRSVVSVSHSPRMRFR
jgi:hypothetical protein